MNTYIGTTQVKAEDMSVGEAYEKKLLKAGQVPSEEEKKLLGYLVEYESGYQFWLPYSDFVNNYHCANNFINRLHIERNALNKRLHDLNKFLASDKILKLDCDMISLMKLQSHAMSLYLGILDRRLDKLEPQVTCGSL